MGCMSSIGFLLIGQSPCYRNSFGGLSSVEKARQIDRRVERTSWKLNIPWLSGIARWSKREIVGPQGLQGERRPVIPAGPAGKGAKPPALLSFGATVELCCYPARRDGFQMINGPEPNLRKIIRAYYQEVSR